MGYADDGHNHAKEYLANLDRQIADHHEYKRQVGLVRIAQVLLVGLALMALYKIFAELGQLPPGFLSDM
jgi:hypothetical protein